MNEPLRHTPSPDHRFWLYSPEGDGLTFWRTAEERDAYAEREIRTYLDDNEWFEEVEGVIAGQVTHITQAVNIKRPSGEIDEDGYDEDENGPWESPDQVMCDYALVPLPEGAMTRTPSPERGCTGKANLGRNYQRSADRLAGRHGKHYGVYSCPHCGGTHLTTKLQNAPMYPPLLYVTSEPPTQEPAP